MCDVCDVCVMRIMHVCVCDEFVWMCGEDLCVCDVCVCVACVICVRIGMMNTCAMYVYVYVLCVYV